MKCFDRIFGHAKAKPKSHKLPSDIVCAEFGEIDVRRTSQSTEVFFTILMKPQGMEAEGWQTGVALDASGWLQRVYGKGLVEISTAEIPQSLLKNYKQRGWLQIVKARRARISIFSFEAKRDLVEKGYFNWSQNEVQPPARQMTAYLASTLDTNGATTVIYWACGGNGRQVEVLGDLKAEDCEKTIFEGPSNTCFGSETYLAPAVGYFVERFKDAKRGLYVFVTHGQIRDLNTVKKLTTQLAKRIQIERRNQVKCVLVGVGNEIDEGQMEQLDNLDTGTDVDIWDHKIAKEMRGLVEIFAELVSENQIVAPTAAVYDSGGNLVKRFTDGLPAKVRFKMSPSSEAFELEVAGRRIRQTLLSRKIP